VNRELVMLYWDIGRGIVEKQQTAGWGEAVVERLAADLRAEFPGMRGFSSRSIWEMKRFYVACTEPDFLQQLVAESQKTRGAGHFDFLQQAVADLAVTRNQPLEQPVPESGGSTKNSILGQAVSETLSQAVRELVAAVPWGHHVLLLGKIKDSAAMFFYLRATAQCGWSRSVLLNQINAGAYERAVREKKTHNFELALPEHLAEQAEEMLKSRYNLEFLGLARPMKERELEERLISRLQQFMLELGYGFCFVGRQYRLELGSKEYFVDLLFYHRFLKALVAFDLKIREFEPEHAGKMDFYLNLLNETERGPDDGPSIGIILCAERDDVEVEFALRSKVNPIGVAKYVLRDKLPPELKGKLPTARQLADVAREFLPAPSPRPRRKTKKP
jgi:predicted nuclease of restriction endonuclease-like (RecB) superfamily